MEPDFAGYVTKAGLKCSDGRTIMPDAFKHQDGLKVPLVWSHGHDDPDNVLGHVLLTNRPDGVWGEAYFNDNTKSQNTKRAVQHGDLEFMSIWANKLAEKAKQVFHGMIREVSLVLAGANPGARIDHVNLEHTADGGVIFELAHSDEESDDILIFTGEKIKHGEDLEDETEGEEESQEEESQEDESTDDDTEEESEEDEVVEHAEGETIQDVIDTMDDKQKNAFAYVVSQLTKSVQHSDTDDEGEHLEHQEGNDVKTKTRNVFEQGSDTAGAGEADNVLSHDEMRGIIRGAFDKGMSLKQAVEDYALSHGIEDIDTLFPNFKDLDQTPQFITRRMEWVATVIDNVGHSPFSRIRTRFADITMEEARAKGYIKGNMKKEEWFSVSKRETGPTTIYKKQKLDRNDILDITDFNAVTWVQAEMKVMLQEEVARAILIGDGRPVEDPNNAGEPNPDKVAEPGAAQQSGNGIRSILNDNELYTITANVPNFASSTTYNEFVDGVLTAMQDYRGSGSPTLYTTLPRLTKVMLARDTLGRRIYQTKADVAAAMGVADIQTVEPMEELTDGTVGIIVNLRDYNVGTDQGGEISFFDFFDIDYNQYKYLYETRFSGALVRWRSAVVIKEEAAGATNLGQPTAPTFNEATGVVTIPTETNVVYKDGAGATLTAGPQTALTAGQSLDVVAVPASGYYFNDNVHDQWHFEEPPA